MIGAAIGRTAAPLKPCQLPTTSQEAGDGIRYHAQGVCLLAHQVAGVDLGSFPYNSDPFLRPSANDNRRLTASFQAPLQHHVPASLRVEVLLDASSSSGGDCNDDQIEGVEVKTQEKIDGKVGSDNLSNSLP